MNLLVIVLKGIKQHSAFPTSSPQKCFYSEKKIQSRTCYYTGYMVL